jgi:hypothetical protein
MGRCQQCGATAPVKHVAFYQNIGMFFMRQQSSIEGELCKRCINRAFVKTTVTTLFLGWWGMISFVVTPFFLINNIVRFLGSIGMSASAAGGVPAAGARRLEKYRAEILARTEDGERLDVVCADVAGRAGVTASDVNEFAMVAIRQRYEELTAS